MNRWIWRGLVLLTGWGGLSAGPAAGEGSPAFFMGNGRTAGEPQSKCWYFDGSWWCMLPGTVSQKTAHRFYRLSGEIWQLVGSRQEVVDERAGARADVLCSGDSLFVLSFHPRESRFLAYRFDRGEGIYRKLEGYPVRLGPLPLRGVETMVLERDGTGRFWAAYEGEPPGGDRGEVRAIWSEDTTGRRWNLEGVRLGVDVDPEDIATVFRFSSPLGGRVGVCWSQQLAPQPADTSPGVTQLLARVYWEGDPPDRWADPEVIASGPALATDQLNTAVAGDSTVYLVTRTHLDALEEKDPDLPLIMLYTRSPGGQWLGYPVSSYRERGTGPIVVFEGGRERLHVFYTQPVGEGRSEQRILHRVSSAQQIDFSGRPEIQIATPGVYLDDATSTKQTVTAKTGVLVMCWGQNRRLGGPRRAYFRLLRPVEE